MKPAFEITDPSIIHELLGRVEYGTLALSHEEQPYSLPMNFVEIDGTIYFHGARTGRKMELIRHNPRASFSIVEPYSMIPSFFSGSDESACPATQFFGSIVIDGMITIVDEYDEKVMALGKLMEKLQSEGGYAPLNDPMYAKTLDVMAVFKLEPTQTRAKFKFGQHLTKKRFECILKHLAERNTPRDRATAVVMHKLRPR